MTPEEIHRAINVLGPLTEILRREHGLTEAEILEVITGIPAPGDHDIQMLMIESRKWWADRLGTKEWPPVLDK